MRGDLATWCRILAVGPPCEIACPDCRARPVTLATVRSLTSPEDPMAEIDPDAEPIGETDPSADHDSYPIEAQEAANDAGLREHLAARAARPDRDHLITAGWTPRLRGLTEHLDATHVEVDLTSDVDVSHVVLAIVDAADLYPSSVIAIGPLMFGWATTGRLRDLRDWALMRAPDIRVIVCPDEEEQETYVQASDAYARVGAVAGLLVSNELALEWLVAETQAVTS